MPTFRGDFPQDVDGLAFQGLEVGERVTPEPIGARDRRIESERRSQPYISV